MVILPYEVIRVLFPIQSVMLKTMMSIGLENFKLSVTSYLSVTFGTMRIRSFGLKLRALSINRFAWNAWTPKGGFSPTI